MDPFYGYRLTAINNSSGQIDGMGWSVADFIGDEVEDPLIPGEDRDGRATIQIGQGDFDTIQALTPLDSFTAGPYVYAGARTDNGHLIGHNGPAFGPLAVGATAFLGYQMRTRLTNADVNPPFLGADIPLLVLVQLEVVTTGRADLKLGALAELQINGPGNQQVLRRRVVINRDTTPDHEHLFDIDLLSVRSDTDYTVFLSAMANIFGATREPATVDAVADPQFMFDQATFDATWGEQSFPLADFYTIEFSPGIVPEPSAALMLFVALTLSDFLSIWRQRRLN